MFLGSGEGCWEPKTIGFVLISLCEASMRTQADARGRTSSQLIFTSVWANLRCMISLYEANDMKHDDRRNDVMTYD